MLEYTPKHNPVIPVWGMKPSCKRKWCVNVVNFEYILKVSNIVFNVLIEKYRKIF
jgi:hypothetical protein